MKIAYRPSDAGKSVFSSNGEIVVTGGRRRITSYNVATMTIEKTLVLPGAAPLSEICYSTRAGLVAFRKGPDIFVGHLSLC